MKITFLVSGSIYGNISYRPLTLARELKARGHDVSIIAPKADKYNNFTPKKVTIIDGVTIVQPFQFVTRHMVINLIPYLISATCSLFVTKSDLIYIYKPTPISIVGLFARCFFGTRVVSDFDDLGSEVMRIDGHPAYQRILVALSEKLAMKYSDQIIAASSYLETVIYTKYPSKQVHLMPNGVDGAWFNSHIKSSHAKRIVFMGSLNRKNILEPLFEVFPSVLKVHPEAELLIIGDGIYRTWFEERVMSLGLNSRTTFTGWLSLEKAQSQLHATDIGYNYMPDDVTIRSASNMKVPQYMACGVVPLVSDVGDLPSTIDYGKAGYICRPDDIKSLTKMLIFALSDPERKTKSQHAIKFATEFLSWDVLASKFDQWISSKKTSLKQKIYVVSTTVPADVGGGEIRNYNLLKQLALDKNNDIELFCISSNDIDIEKKKIETEIPLICHIVPSSVRTLLTLIRAIIYGVPPSMDDFALSDLGSNLRAACEKSLPDVVHIEQLHAYYCIQKHIKWLKDKGVTIVLDCHNVEFQAFKDSLNIFPFARRMVGLYFVSKLKRLEIEATKQSNIVFVCSEIDAVFFKRYKSPFDIHVIPNGVDCNSFEKKRMRSKPILVFMGGVGYPPNADAMRWYLSSIHPLVKSQVPDVKLLAIGTSKEWLEMQGLLVDSVEPLGFVEDVRPYLQDALVGICPIRYGSGTRIKIMTYMASGLPVVSTHKGAEGVAYASGTNIIFADDAINFADEIVKLCNQSTLRQEITKNGLEFVKMNCDWNIIGNNVRKIYHSLI